MPQQATSKVMIVLELAKCADRETGIKCPFLETKRTQGAGYAEDYYCKLLGRITSGYVEWDRDVNPIPEDCPRRLEKIAEQVFILPQSSPLLQRNAPERSQKF